MVELKQLPYVVRSYSKIKKETATPIGVAVSFGESHRKRYLLIFVTFMVQLQEAHLEPIYSFCFSTQAFRPLLLQ